MSSQVLLIISIAYLALLLFFANFFRKRSALSNNKITYALSLCVYCTAWTFYGSIGRSAETGLGFLGVYLGPTLAAPFMLLALVKTIKISKHLRISSIADFISSRYGKNAYIGALVTIICILIAIPYISIQLKALHLSFNLLAVDGVEHYTYNEYSFYTDPALIFGIMCALVSMFFGTIKASPSERHTGVISVIAAESLIKLAAFLLGAFVIIYYLNDGIAAIFTDYKKEALNFELLSLNKLYGNGNQWFWITFISAFAFLLLPRQFHMAVVENNNVNHVKFASWFVPLYLFAISILVVPIALEGNISIGSASNPDNYLSKLLLNNNLVSIALIVFIGGLAASSGMIISSLMSLAIMLSNHIALPLLLKVKSDDLFGLERNIIYFRRLLILVILILSYGFYRIYATNFSLVSIGLISFVGIGQLIPAFILGLYWKYANSKGAFAGICVGIFIWAFTLPLANLAEIGIVNPSILGEGVFGISFLKPYALFGVSNMDPISHSCFWSLSSNFIVTFLVSLYTQRDPIELAQADVFLNPNKYILQNQGPILSRAANFGELKSVLVKILGNKKVDKILAKYLKENKLQHFEKHADSELIQYLENYLSGSIGSTCSRIILNNIVKNEPIQADQLFKVLDQTNQLYDYSKQLEENRDELKKKTEQLSEANLKLTELDHLKGEFIANVTHELRTPLTSIRSLADALGRFDLSNKERAQILAIIKDESIRISDLVNQVLDLRKIESKPILRIENFELKSMIAAVIESFSDIKGKRSITLIGEDIYINSDSQKIMQILINIIANAIKYSYNNSSIKIALLEESDFVKISVTDNGIGIHQEDVEKIFDRFYQSNRNKAEKSKGSGLGLSISKSLIALLSGKIEVESKLGEFTRFSIYIPNLKQSNINQNSVNDYIVNSKT